MRTLWTQKLKGNPMSKTVPAKQGPVSQPSQEVSAPESQDENLSSAKELEKAKAVLAKHEAKIKAAQPKTKTVLARILNADGDLVMAPVEVPLEDKRPPIDPKRRIAQDDGVMEGNPGKNAPEGSPVTLD